MLPGAFEYSMQLPEGIEYVPNSITTSFPDGNGPNDVMNPLTENYDQVLEHLLLLVMELHQRHLLKENLPAY